MISLQQVLEFADSIYRSRMCGEWEVCTSWCRGVRNLCGWFFLSMGDVYSG